MSVSLPVFDSISAAGFVPLGVVVGAFAMLAAGEALIPARRSPADDGRITTNFVLGIGNGLVAMAVPIGTVAAALTAARNGIGLFQTMPVPVLAEIALLLTLRSLAAYGLHRASHANPWLWRVHRVHHADAAIDLSTGLRNHPIEAVLALAVAIGVTLAVGASVAATIVVDVILFTGALWQHAAIALPSAVEHLIGSVAMTPARHLRHHGIAPGDHHGNFGDVTVLWDRLFGTLAPPAPPDLPVGLAGEGARASRLVSQLAAPFRADRPLSGEPEP